MGEQIGCDQKFGETHALAGQFIQGGGRRRILSHLVGSQRLNPHVVADDEQDIRRRIQRAGQEQGGNQNECGWADP